MPKTFPDAGPQRGDLGAAIRELRLCRCHSQASLATLTSIHHNYVGALERGEVNPTFRTLTTVALALGVELSSLIRLAEERAEDRAIGATP